MTQTSCFYPEISQYSNHNISLVGGVEKCVSLRRHELISLALIVYQ